LRGLDLCCRRSGGRSQPSNSPLCAGEFGHDVELTSMSGVLGHDVKADPLQCRRVVGEATACQSTGLELVITEDRACPITYDMQLGGQVFCGDVIANQPSGFRTIAGAAGAPRLWDIPVAPRVGNGFGKEAPDEPTLFHVQQVAQQFDWRPPARQPRLSLRVQWQRKDSVDQISASPIEIVGPALCTGRPSLVRFLDVPAYSLIVAHAGTLMQVRRVPAAHPRVGRPLRSARGLTRLSPARVCEVAGCSYVVESRSDTGRRCD
jgi:hypothetical protein